MTSRRARVTSSPTASCRHNCFARPTHTYLDFDAGRDFEREIVVKVNVPEVLRAELRRPSWKGEHIAMGTNTDPYQWVEGRYRLMRGIWEALRDSRNPCSVLTKSPLLLRDLALLQEIAEVTDISANLSIPTIDEKAWRATEPHTPHPRARLEAVAELNRAGIPTGILVAPLMPGINDDPKQVEEIIQTAIDAGATCDRRDRPAPARRGARRVHGVAALLPAGPGRALRGAVRARRVPAGSPSATGSRGCCATRARRRRRPFRRDPADERPFDRTFRRQMGPRGGRREEAEQRRPGRPDAVQEALF